MEWSGGHPHLYRLPPTSHTEGTSGHESRRETQGSDIPHSPTTKAALADEDQDPYDTDGGENILPEGYVSQFNADGTPKLGPEGDPIMSPYPPRGYEYKEHYHFSTTAPRDRARAFLGNDAVTLAGVAYERFDVPVTLHRRRWPVR